MAAAAFDAGEFVLDKKEADVLGEAVANVASHYPVSLDPKIMAWVQLGVASATIYGGKAWAFYGRKSREEKAEAPAKPSPLATVPKFGG